MSMKEKTRAKVEVRNVIPGHGLVVDMFYPCFGCENGASVICANCLQNEKIRSAFAFISYLRSKEIDVTEEDIDYIREAFEKYGTSKAKEILKKKFKII